MQNGFFLFLFVEIFLFNTPFRETHIVRRLRRLSAPGALCAVVPCGTIRILYLEGAPRKPADEQLGDAL